MLKLLLVGFLIYFVWKSARFLMGPIRPEKPSNPPWFGSGMGGKKGGEKDITERTRIINENQEDDR